MSRHQRYGPEKPRHEYSEDFVEIGRKAIFFDIDGTLYDREHAEGVPDSARLALRKLRERGHRIFICTGRVNCAVEQSLRALNFDGMILGCGTQILYHDRQLFYHRMEQELVVKLLRLVKSGEGIGILEGKDGLYRDPLPEESPLYAYYEKRRRLMGPVLKTVTGHRWEISKMTVRFPWEIGDRRACLLQEASAWVDVIDSGKSAEFVPKGFSKATGIAYILEKLGIDREDTIAFGDSMNDYEMLSYVGHGIAMGNSSEEILELCADHTDSVYEDGIYNACVRNRLI